jgi:hypothetical protein
MSLQTDACMKTRLSCKKTRTNRLNTFRVFFFHELKKLVSYPIYTPCLRKRGKINRCLSRITALKPPATTHHSDSNHHHLYLPTPLHHITSFHHTTTSSNNAKTSALSLQEAFSLVAPGVLDSALDVPLHSVLVPVAKEYYCKHSAFVSLSNSARQS